MKTNHRRGFVMGFGYSETSLSQCEQQERNLAVKREGKREIEAQLDDMAEDDYEAEQIDAIWLNERLRCDSTDSWYGDYLYAENNYDYAYEDAEWEAGYRNPYDEPMLDDGFADWIDDDPDYYTHNDSDSYEFIPTEPPPMAKPIVFKKFSKAS